MTSFVCLLLLSFNDRSCFFNGEKPYNNFTIGGLFVIRRELRCIVRGMFVHKRAAAPHTPRLPPLHPLGGRLDAAVAAGEDAQPPVHMLTPPHAAATATWWVFSTGSCRWVASTRPVRRRDGSHLGLPGTTNPGTVLGLLVISSGNHPRGNCPVIKEKC